MLTRIDGFYTPRPTLRELTETAGTSLLVWGTALPAGVDGDALSRLIWRECADLDTLAVDVDNFVDLWESWLVEHSVGWAREYAALIASYDPLHNYDRTDTETESITSSGTASSTGSTEDGGEDVKTYQRQGFDSSNFSDVNKESDAYGRTQDSSTSSQSAGTSSRSKTLTSSGNIGVTTSQQMLESELRLRRDWNIYKLIADDFRCELCVEVW